jgi:sulfonate transport system substrate-binding protein
MSRKVKPLLLAVAGAAAGLAFVAATTIVSAAEPKKIRIGWQPTTTVEAQIAHAMAKTDILEKNGLKGEMIMFSYGPAVNEALVSGAIDVGFIGDMPSVSLAAANSPTTVIGRQSVFRGSIVASTKSGITSLEGLKGKKLHGPFGSSIYLAAQGMLEKAGLKPGKDVEMVNMGFADLSDGIKAGKVDAVFVWDPWIELFVVEGLGKVLASDTSLTMVIAMRDDYLKKNPDAAKSFLKAHKEALLFAASDHARANAWFREPEAARKLDVKVIQTATAYDPQWNAKSPKDIRLSFTDAELKRYFGLAKQAHQLKIFPKEPPLPQKTNLSMAKELDAKPWDFDPKKVKIVK